MKPIYNQYGVIPEDSPLMEGINTLDRQMKDLFSKAAQEGYDISHLVVEINNLSNYHYCLHRMRQGILLRREEREIKKLNQ